MGLATQPKLAENGSVFREWHCRPANLAGITLKLYDLLHLRYGYIYFKYHDQ